MSASLKCSPNHLTHQVKTPKSASLAPSCPEAPWSSWCARRKLSLLNSRCLPRKGGWWEDGDDSRSPQRHCLYQFSGLHHIPLLCFQETYCSFSTYTPLQPLHSKSSTRTEKFKWAGLTGTCTCFLAQSWRSIHETDG